jgi:hypothetical protein
MARVFLLLMLLSLIATSCVEENDTSELTSEDIIDLNWTQAVKDFDYPMEDADVDNRTRAREAHL